MADYIINDPSHATVPGLVVGVHRSVGAGQAELDANPDAVRNPPGFALTSQGRTKWNGVGLVLLSAQEELDMAAAAAAANLADQKTGLKEQLISEGEATFHLLHAMVEEFHAHVDSPTKTVNQLKVAIKNNADARIDAIT